MGHKYPAPRRFKIHHLYLIPDLAATAGVHPHTVRNWIYGGLKPIDEQRPIYIKGDEIRRFLAEKRHQVKSPCRLDELFCLGCRTPRRPAGDMAELLKLEGRARLTGICPVCGKIMRKWVSLKSIPALTATLDIPDMNPSPVATSGSTHNGGFIPLSEL